MQNQTCLLTLVKLITERGDVPDGINSAIGTWDHPSPLSSQYQLPRDDIPPVHMFPIPWCDAIA